MKFSLSRTHSCTMGAILMISGLVPITMAILIGCLCKITSHQSRGYRLDPSECMMSHFGIRQATNIDLSIFFLNVDKGSAERDTFRYARLRKNTLRFAKSRLTSNLRCTTIVTI